MEITLQTERRIDGLDRLKYVKDSNPIELSDYAVANRIQEEPAFKRWVSETLRMRNRIIGKV